VRVLVVEDSADLAYALALSLRFAGHEAKTVSENFADLLVPEAWAGMDAAVIDLQLRDRNVSGADVIEAGARIRPSARLVLLTGSERGNGQTFDRASRWACAVLRKPVTAKLLLAVLEAT